MKPAIKTAIFCCGARMIDADSVKPVCGDNLARLFMDKDAIGIFDIFKPLKNAIISNATRHRIIDDLVKRELENNPQTMFIQIGSGFDTRAYRFEYGKWVELDDPQLIEYKNDRLPISKCTNILKRIPYDYEKDSLSAKLSEFKTGKPVVIIIEGVFIYLEDAAIRKLLKTVQRTFPNHVLLCDLQTVSFLKTFGKNFQRAVSQSGSPLKISSDTPEHVFLEAGYAINQRISILDKTVKYAKLSVSQKVAKILINSLFRKVKDGYSVYVFRYIA